MLVKSRDTGDNQSPPGFTTKGVGYVLSFGVIFVGGRVVLAGGGGLVMQIVHVITKKALSHDL
jgi:hypothetical protein